MKNADWALVISLGILWGMSFFLVELLLAYLSPFMIVYLRVAIGTFFLLAYVLIKKSVFDWSAETILTLIVMALLNNVVPFLLITIGQQNEIFAAIVIIKLKNILIAGRRNDTNNTNQGANHTVDC